VYAPIVFIDQSGLGLFFKQYIPLKSELEKQSRSDEEEIRAFKNESPDSAPVAFFSFHRTLKGRVVLRAKETKWSEVISFLNKDSSI